MGSKMTYSQARAYSDFIDNMRNPGLLELYPFDVDMASVMFKENNVFFNINPAYKHGEETICAYLAYAALTDPDFNLCIMADSPEKFKWINDKIYYFIKKSRFSLITKLLACSRMVKHYYVSVAKYVYIAEYEKTFDPDDNCFIGWIHPKTDDAMTDDSRPFTYGAHVVEYRQHDMRNHTIISGKDAYDVLKTKVGKYILYFDATENTSL